MDMDPFKDQNDPWRSKLTRRAFLRASLVVPPTVMLAACAEESPNIGTVEDITAETLAPTPPLQQSTTTTATQAPGSTSGAMVLRPTPACGDDDDPTPPQTEGPFFTPNSPQRTSLLEPGIEGTRMILTGFVLTTDCQPVAGALLDFWHADNAGVYDNDGYKLRGHQFTDATGRYYLETIVPGLYPERTRHFHVRGQAPGGPLLTTQLYFPGEAANEEDGIFDPALLVNVQESEDGTIARFDFILQMA